MRRGALPRRRQPRRHSVECADGSVGTVLYAASGDAAMPKERVEVLGRGRSAMLDNYQSLTTWAGNRKKRARRRSRSTRATPSEVARWIESLVAPGAAADRAGPSC